MCFLVLSFGGYLCDFSGLFFLGYSYFYFYFPSLPIRDFFLLSLSLLIRVFSFSLLRFLFVHFLPLSVLFTCIIPVRSLASPLLIHVFPYSSFSSLDIHTETRLLLAPALRPRAPFQPFSSARNGGRARRCAPCDASMSVIIVFPEKANIISFISRQRPCDALYKQHACISHLGGL